MLHAANAYFILCVRGGVFAARKKSDAIPQRQCLVRHLTLSPHFKWKGFWVLCGVGMFAYD